MAASPAERTEPMILEDVKAHLHEPDLLALLGPSMYLPTPERVAARADGSMRDGSVAAYACRMDGAWAGLIVLSVTEDTAVIRAIATEQDARGRGVGRFMMEQAMTMRGLSELTAETDNDAVGFYRRCGFAVEVCGRIDGRTRYRCRKTRT